MGYILIQNLEGSNEYNRKLFYCDTNADLPPVNPLDNTISVGSEALILDHTAHYVLNTAYQWISVPWGVNGEGSIATILDIPSLETSPKPASYVRSIDEEGLVDWSRHFENFQPVLSTDDKLKNANILYFYTDTSELVRYKEDTDEFVVMPCGAGGGLDVVPTAADLPVPGAQNQVIMVLDTGSIYWWNQGMLQWDEINISNIDNFQIYNAGTLPGVGEKNVLYYLNDLLELYYYDEATSQWISVKLNFLEDAPNNIVGKLYARKTTSAGKNEWTEIKGAMDDAPSDIDQVMYIRKTEGVGNNIWTPFSTIDLLEDAPKEAVGTNYVRTTTSSGENEWTKTIDTLDDAPSDVVGKIYVRRTAAIGSNEWYLFETDSLEDAPTDIGGARYIRVTNDVGVNEWQRLVDVLSDAPSDIVGKIYVRETDTIGNNVWREFKTGGLEDAPAVIAGQGYIRKTNAAGVNEWVPVRDVTDDAPTDIAGMQYVRKTTTVGTNQWMPLDVSTLEDAPKTAVGKKYVRRTNEAGVNEWVVLTDAMDDAPSDVLGKKYVRSTTEIGVNTWVDLTEALNGNVIIEQDQTLFPTTGDPAKVYISLSSGAIYKYDTINAKYIAINSDVIPATNLFIANTKDDFPIPGVANKLYFALDDKKFYIYKADAYVAVGGDNTCHIEQVIASAADLPAKGNANIIYYIQDENSSYVYDAQRNKYKLFSDSLEGDFFVAQTDEDLPDIGRTDKLYFIRSRQNIYIWRPCGEYMYQKQNCEIVINLPAVLKNNTVYYVSSTRRFIWNNIDNQLVDITAKVEQTIAIPETYNKDWEFDVNTKEIYQWEKEYMYARINQNPNV